ncbi:class I SAM-dependent methyltransferase [Aquipuribacter nitratireducens]|uniref:Class I SAM-dependent methyltransferase n=1 Tax=Aquipuribacter nitratireducens TaxID=650104 RepID=A0ABW0GN77_9MICO
MSGHGHGPGHGHDDVVFDQGYWEDRYRTRDTPWSGRANAVLVAEATALPTGRALDLGCGTGGDVLWLAQHGWTVTGVDWSREGLAQGATDAERLGADVARRVTWQQADLETWEPDPVADRCDLVTSHFLHLPREAMRRLAAAACGAVAPGGTLLVVLHDVTDMETGLRRPDMVERFVPVEELADAVTARPDVAGWDVRTDRRRREQAGPDGEPVAVTDAVLLVRRPD